MRQRFYSEYQQTQLKPSLKFLTQLSELIIFQANGRLARILTFKSCQNREKLFRIKRLVHYYFCRMCFLFINSILPKHSSIPFILYIESKTVNSVKLKPFNYTLFHCSTSVLKDILTICTFLFLLHKEMLHLRIKIASSLISSFLIWEISNIKYRLLW